MTARRNASILGAAVAGAALVVGFSARAQDGPRSPEAPPTCCRYELIQADFADDVTGRLATGAVFDRHTGRILRLRKSGLDAYDHYAYDVVEGSAVERDVKVEER